MGPKVAASSSNSSQMQKWWKQLWVLKMPSKVKHFIWRPYHNCLPTKANLLSRHVMSDAICPVCWKCPKTSDHALFKCSRAKKIWRLIHPDIKIKECYSHYSIQDHFLDLMVSHNETMFSWICFGAWTIWND